MRDVIRNKQGGGPPAGAGAHSSEEHLWKTPKYRTHPLTGKKEAATMGLFFRMWPEHVKILQRMYKENWGHNEIVRVAAELWKRQEEENKKNEETVDKLKEHRHESFQDTVQSIHEYNPDTEPSQEEPDFEPPPGLLERSLASGNSLVFRGPEEIDAYNEVLQSYRKRFSRAPGTVHLRKARNVEEIHKLPRLPFAYDALEPVIPEETMRAHHSVHHKNYVEGLNKILSYLSPSVKNLKPVPLAMQLKRVPDDYQEPLRFYLGGHLNHSLLWNALKPPGLPSEPDPVPDPEGDLSKMIKKKFGSIAGLWKKMLAVSKDMIGPGWVYLVATPELEVYPFLLQDNPVMENMVPLLGVDFWEHAYYKKHGPDKEAYISELGRVTDWKEVERRLNWGGMFFKKGDTSGGVRTLTPQEERTRYEQTFTRKDPGVINASPSPSPDLVGKKTAKTSRVEDDEDSKEA